MPEILNFENLNKTFVTDGKDLRVLENINFAISEGEFVVIVGRSGCGKSTLLKIIAGLETADKGSSVLYLGNEITSPGPERSMIFQEHRLMPWLTVEKNVALGLSGISAKERKILADKYLKLVQLESFKKAYPAELSGGMSQRVAIARALTTEPGVLLLDEPFGALDALTKIEMQSEILNLRLMHNNTMVMVTHDIEEAVYLADRIVIMSNLPGKIKDIVNIQLSEHRDRNSADFAFYKKKIYDYFFEPSEKDTPEFII